MPRTAAAAIAAWLAHGDPSATLVIQDADCTALPPLPTTVTKLYCYWCEQLTALPALPAALTHLRCFGCGLTSLGNLSALPLVAIELSVCRALAALPPLPATLVLLDLNECTALVALPRLPAALTTLQCYWCTALVALPQLSTHHTLANLHCDGCYSLLRLPVLPVKLQRLSVPAHTVLTDTLPPNLLEFINVDAIDWPKYWRLRVVNTHAADRQHVCTILPWAALLFV